MNTQKKAKNTHLLFHSFVGQKSRWAQLVLYSEFHNFTEVLAVLGSSLETLGKNFLSVLFRLLAGSDIITSLLADGQG